jgi:hypothetical protein
MQTCHQVAFFIVRVYQIKPQGGAQGLTGYVILNRKQTLLRVQMKSDQHKIQPALVSAITNSMIDRSSDRGFKAFLPVQTIHQTRLSQPPGKQSQP